MKNLKKNAFMLKLYSNRKKDLFRIFVLGVISICLITTTLIFIKTNEAATLDELFDMYGKYTVSIEGDYFSTYEKIAADKNVNDSIAIYNNAFFKDHVEYTYYYGDEKSLDFININLVDGSFPVNDNEILIERNFLFNLGISETEMIGSTIVLPLDNKDNTGEFTVTGIITKNSIQQGEEPYNSFIVVFPINNVQPNKLLVQLTDMADFENIMDHITKKYDLDKDLCYINYDLFMALGLVGESNVLKQNDLLYSFLYSIILLCTIISLYNFIKLMIYNSSTDMSILNLLGIPKNLIVSTLFALIISIIFVAAIMGILFGIGISNLIINKFFNNLNIIHLFEHSFPHKTMLVSIFIYIFIAILIRLC